MGLAKRSLRLPRPDPFLGTIAKTSKLPLSWLPLNSRLVRVSFITPRAHVFCARWSVPMLLNLEPWVIIWRPTSNHIAPSHSSADKSRRTPTPTVGTREHQCMRKPPTNCSYGSPSFMPYESALVFCPSPFEGRKPLTFHSKPQERRRGVGGGRLDCWKPLTRCV